MNIVYYEVIFALSFVLSVIYVFIWRKHYNTDITIIFTLVPIANLGYLMQAMATDVNSYIRATQIAYIGGCFVMFFFAMCVLSLCDIKLYKYIRFVGFVLVSILYGFILTIGKNEFFYKDLIIRDDFGERLIIKEYGPMHTVFYAFIFTFFAISFVSIIYGIIRKKQIPNRVLYMLFLPAIFSVMGYFGYAFFKGTIETVPLTYVVAQVVYIFIVKRMSLYQVGDMVVEAMVQSGDVGFISIDRKGNYLGSNETAKSIIPALREIKVDKRLMAVKELDKTVNHWLSIYKEDRRKNENLYVVREETNENNNRYFKIIINPLYFGKKQYGYQMLLNDDTKNQQYIALMDNYNDELEEKVEQKTKDIIEMHNNLILGMATMVESRDNSTGGHIKRTSIGVQILIDEINNLGELKLSDTFCKNIIKAAPMHDIGKIAVDDAVLRKPGRFTDEEYEKMKKHSSEGARIIREILKDTDDEEFKIIAENVAHYHHERWDGSGYPEGLKGEEIPLEARIMAIADVYDALVSKRVYKEKMSFEEADRIIMEGMGQHFDMSLKSAYEKARPRLEKYYESLE